ncbi:hypothetical protein EKK58_01895 [Candidatus Dependentiae bacterium]|nr:MAG: hypothetical protein EKK58_01895 [Candidatus Dependentiae bacterium]
MIQKYTAWCVNILLCALLIFVSNIQIVDGNGSSLKNTVLKIAPSNIFHTLEQPIMYLLSLKNRFIPMYNAFYQWHEHVFYYTVDDLGNKKMFLSARIVTALIPWVIIGTVVYTNPTILHYIWNVNYANVNYASASSIPSTITPAFIAQKIGKLSSFNQNCIMIGAEKGLQWLISRKIAPDLCLNPATWFTDQANHNFINMITSLLVILFSWIYILYCVYLNSIIHHKNLIKIIFFQFCIRYALYLTSLKNNVHALVLSEQLENYTKNPDQQIASADCVMQKELKNAIEHLAETVQQLKDNVQRIV